jgi:hypothetical protein
MLATSLAVRETRYRLPPRAVACPVLSDVGAGPAGTTRSPWTACSDQPNAVPELLEDLAGMYPD